VSRTTELSEEADILWRKAVKLGQKCEICLSTQELHAHHMHRRGGTRYRWDIRNGVCLCKWCHAYTHDIEGWIEEQLELRNPAKLAFHVRTKRYAKDVIVDKAEWAEKAIEKLKGIIEANT